jgi:hypothetical protein
MSFLPVFDGSREEDREYTLEEIKRLLVSSGFEISRTAYFQQYDPAFLIRQKNDSPTTCLIP